MWNVIKTAFTVLFAWRDEQNKGKSPLRSKTFWGIVLSWFALMLTQFAGITLTAEEQTAILGFIAIILRLITKQPVGFWQDK